MTPHPRRLTQAQRSERTRERLIAAAIDALYRFGYPATSTTLVAGLAGVSRGAMLHQFAAKSQLMAAVMETTHQWNVDAYQEALSDRALSPEARLFALLDAAWMRHSSPGGVAQNEIRAATRSDPELAERVMPVHLRHVEETRAAFARLMGAAGVKDTAVSDALLTLTVSALRGMALEKALGHGDTRSEAAVLQLKRTLKAMILGAQADGASTQQADGVG